MPRNKAQYIVGILNLNRRGFGFVKPFDEYGFSEDIFIPARHIYEAIDKDVVEVEVLNKISEKGAEGIITAIIERAKNRLVAIIENKTDKVYELFSPQLGPTKRLFLSTKKHLEKGCQVLVNISKKQRKKELLTTLIKVIGPIEDPSYDISCAIEEFNLHDTFSHHVIEEAKKFKPIIHVEKTKERKDLTDLECVTIDPENAKDFDDAISLTQDDKKNYHLGVHIADVAHYIKPDSALDKEALARGNSIYFPERVLPMLPEALSSHLCSLKPNEIRLSVSVLMTFDEKGHLKYSKILRSYIKSRKRFTYNEALSILETNQPNLHLSLLKRMKALGLILKKQRLERGSIDFSLPEGKLIVDDKGDVQGINISEYDITHQMIEEFMLKANEVVAKYLNKKGRFLIYRIHEEPEEENFKDFFELVEVLGFKLPKKITHLDIQKVFLKAKKTPYFQQLSINFIRSMKLACYSLDNIGHYGLALEHYCHFTSPIRRYSDLIVQRLLFDEIEEDVDLQKIASSCSEKERIAFQAEMAVIRLKKLRLIELYFEQDPYKKYSAVITKVKPYYLLFEVNDVMFEGSISVSELVDDYYLFDKNLFRLRGKRTNNTYSVGQTIDVKILSIDIIRQHIDWEIVTKTKRKKKK